MIYTCAAIPEKSPLFQQTRELRLSLEALNHVYSGVSRKGISKKENVQLDCCECQNYYDHKVEEFQIKFNTYGF